MSFLGRLFGRGGDGPEAAPQGGAPPPNRHEIHRQLARGGQTLSLRQLRSYGLHAVRVLDAPTIHKVVHEAVEKVLRDRPRGAPPLTTAERAKVEDQTREHVLRLMQQNEQLVASHSQVERRRAELEQQTKALREELAAHQAELTQERARTVRTIVVIDDESFVEMERRVRALLERMARGGELEGPDGKLDLRPFERELGELLSRVVGDVKKKNAGAVDEARVEELELRIAKLNEALEQREDAIRKLAAMKGYDGGIASIYDVIQGLDPASLEFKRKSELLKEVFTQNMELHGVTLEPTDHVFPIAPAPRMNPMPVGISAVSDGASTDEVAF
jgi:hypothetical protein